MIIYLASPYSHEDSDVVEERVRKSAQAAAKLIQYGHIVFCPVTHSHLIAKHGALGPFDHDLWMEQDKVWLEKCDLVLVLMLDGWGQSKGVKQELAWAEQMKKPIVHCSEGSVHCDDFSDLEEVV